MNNIDYYSPRSLKDLYEHSTSTFSECRMSWQTDGEQSYTYKSFRTACDSLSSRLLSIGAGYGEKVVILSQSMPNWALAFFSITIHGAVAIPLLPDFTQAEVSGILAHSGARYAFIQKKLLPRISDESMAALDAIIDIETLEFIREPSESSKPAAEESASEPQGGDLAAIIYTSGTTGQAKGVMLSHTNFCANMVIGINYYPIGTSDTLLSILPMAHTYELSLGMLYPFYCGSSVCYMSRMPTPTILIATMCKVRPTAILSVPLILEKIYKGSIIPFIRRNALTRWSFKHLNGLMCRIIGRRMKNLFGGRIRFFGIGGAKLDPDIEAFLQKARFPYYIGYGLTECAPLLILSKWHSTVPGSIGFPGYGVSIRLMDINEETGQGEIVAKGDNIMLGYYKDPERTRAAFTSDGWFRTNDLASVDKEGRYYIKGRLNNMILGASGENIYPEEIEKVINDFEGVNESLVLERDGRLTALVNFNEDVFDWRLEGEVLQHLVDEKKKELIKFVNSHVKKSSRITDVGVMKKPFEKNATRKIRRYIYKERKPDA